MAKPQHPENFKKTMNAENLESPKSREHENNADYEIDPNRKISKSKKSQNVTNTEI